MKAIATTGFAISLLAGTGGPVIAASADPSIARLNYAGFSRLGHCTATLIGPKAALTAKHCVEKRPASTLHLVFGYHNREWLDHKRVESIHADATRDIAVLCMKGTSSFTPKTVSPEKFGHSGALLTVTGYRRSQAHRQTDLLCAYKPGKVAIRLECLSEPGLSGAPVLNAQGAVLGVLKGHNRTHSIAIRASDLPEAPCLK